MSDSEPAKPKRRHRDPRPPGIHSPLGALAWSRRFGADPYGSVAELEAKYGPVVGVSAGVGPRMVFLFGVEGNEFILSGDHKHFRFREAFQTLAPVTGQTALIVSDGDEHTTRRSLVQPAFRPSRVDGYVDMMAEEADNVISALQPGQTIDLFPAFRGSTRRSVIRALFGDEMGERTDEIGETIGPAIDFVNLPPQQQIRIRAPGSKYQAAIKARRATDVIIDEEIDRRLGLPESQRSTNDVLAMLLATQDDNGTRLSRIELRDQLISLIAAGYDTTAAGIGWGIDRLLTEPGVWDIARAELAEVVGDRSLTAQDFDNLPYLDGVVQETLRLNPPGVLAVRYAVDSFKFGGYRIRKKSLVFYSPYTTQRDPSLWSDPEKFDPMRWHQSGVDRWIPRPQTFVTFGGGARRCVGFGFATLQMKVALAVLVRRAEIEPAYSGGGWVRAWPRSTQWEESQSRCCGPAALRQLGDPAPDHFRSVAAPAEVVHGGLCSRGWNLSGLPRFARSSGKQSICYAKSQHLARSSGKRV